MALSLILVSFMIESGAVSNGISVASSHFCAAERQYRFPLEYGNQRPPTSQWTVTGAAAFAVEKSGEVAIKQALPGIVVEKGINDASNMGAAMAPAAADTILRYFELSGEKVSDVGAIITGDLGFEGGEILCELLSREGLDIRAKYNDCGALIYDRIRQDKHAGGSGCGCSAVVLSAYLLGKLRSGELKNLLFIGTGAMMSPSSIQQGQYIPAVAHLLRLEGKGGNI
jgi:stage V sporulation protein AD